MSWVNERFRYLFVLLSLVIIIPGPGWPPRALTCPTSSHRQGPSQDLQRWPPVKHWSFAFVCYTAIASWYTDLCSRKSAQRKFSEDGGWKERCVSFQGAGEILCLNLSANYKVVLTLWKCITSGKLCRSDTYIMFELTIRRIGKCPLPTL